MSPPAPLGERKKAAARRRAAAPPEAFLAGADPASDPGSGWSRSIVRGVRANDLSGKAGEVAAELEERLVSGRYRFGETLSIYTLAEQFEASRQPVAAAVLYLRSVGYLEIIPQVGCRVVSPRPQEVEDFYCMFSRTEALISRFAAERHQGGEAQELLTMAEGLAANPFKSSYDRRATGDGISLFHDRISAMARSPLLVERISNLRRIFRFYLSQNRVRPDPVAGPPQRMNRLRIELAKAIIARQAQQAEHCTESYILKDLDDWARVV